MTSDEFRSTLKSLSLRQNTLADRLGVDTSTVHRWAIGATPVPQYAVAYLELLALLDPTNP